MQHLIDPFGEDEAQDVGDQQVDLASMFFSNLVEKDGRSTFEMMAQATGQDAQISNGIDNNTQQRLLFDTLQIDAPSQLGAEDADFNLEVENLRRQHPSKERD